MKKIVNAVSILLILLFIAAPGFALTLDFEDITPDGISMPYGYAGMTWSNFGAIQKMTNGSGYEHGIDGNVAIYNLWGDAAATSDDETFDFFGGNFTAAWRDGLNIKIDGLLNGAVIYSRTIVVDHDEMENLACSMLGIDMLKFKSWGGLDVLSQIGEGGHFLLENMQIGSTVPEPATMMLFGLGLLGLAGISRKKITA